jgi:transposase
MIRPGYLDDLERTELTRLARNGTVAHRLARRANALVLLDRGLSCEAVADVLLLDDDTIRGWFKLYEKAGIQSLAEFGYRGSAPRLSDVQQERLGAWITATLPRTTREVGAWIEAEFGIVYDSRSGLVKLLHRLGMQHHRPQEIARKLDPAKQVAFIAFYAALLTHNRTHERFGDFKEAVLNFLNTDVPKRWRTLCDMVTDNFRVIAPKDFRVIA